MRDISTKEELQLAAASNPPCWSFACSSTPFSAKSAEPLDGYESFLAEVRSPLPRVTAINASLQRSTSGNPSSADVKRYPEHDGRPVSPDRGHTHWRHVRNPRALDDTCDGLTRDSHTLVFQSMALFPLFLPGGLNSGLFLRSNGEGIRYCVRSHFRCHYLRAYGTCHAPLFLPALRTHFQKKS